MVCAGITLAGDLITVQYNAADGTRGASFTNPYRLIDIIDSIGNGCTAKAGVYYFPFRIRFLGASTFFLTANEVIHIDVIQNLTTFDVGAGVNFKSIRYVNPNLWYYGGGTTLYQYKRGNVTLRGEIDSMKIINSAYVYIRDAIFKNSQIDHFAFLYLYSSSLENVQAGMYTGAALLIVSGTVTINNVWFNYCFVRIYVYNMTLKNCVFANNTYDLQIFPAYGNKPTITLQDCRIDYTKYQITSSGYGTNTLYYKSTFKINIKDGDGATARIIDQQGNIVATQILDGEWERLTSYVKHVVETNAGIIRNELTEYEPFSLEVEKEGFQKLTIPGITVIAGQPTIIRGELVPVPATVFIDRRVQGQVAAKKITGTASVKRLTGVVRQSVSISGTVRPLISITGNVSRKQIEGEVKT